MISLSIRVVVASFQHIPLGTLPQLTKTKKSGDFSLALYSDPVLPGRW